MGKPATGKAVASRERREPGELKHLSSPRKREDSVSSGERTRSSPNHTRVWGCRVSEELWKLKGNSVGKLTREGESPVPEGGSDDEIPEYRRTREIQRETGETTPQG
jgi:hypothetical protein